MQILVTIAATALATVLVLALLELLGVPALTWLTIAVHWTQTIPAALASAAATTSP